MTELDYEPATPEQARKWLDRIHVRYVIGAELELPEASPGQCDDCARDAEFGWRQRDADSIRRWHIGSHSLCRDCASNRLTVQCQIGETT